MYIITGADVKTGQERVIILEAADEEAAVALAKQQGVFAYSIKRELESQGSGAPMRPAPRVDQALTLFWVVLLAVLLLVVLVCILICNTSLAFELKLSLIAATVAAAILVPYLISLASMSHPFRVLELQSLSNWFRGRGVVGPAIAGFFPSGAISLARKSPTTHLLSSGGSANGEPDNLIITDGRSLSSRVSDASLPSPGARRDQVCVFGFHSRKRRPRRISRDWHDTCCLLYIDVDIQ